MPTRFVELIERDGRVADLGQDGLFERHRHTVLGVRQRHHVGARLDRILCVAHRHAQSRQLEHRHVADTVADGHHVRRVDPLLLQQHRERVRLVDRLGHHLQVIILRPQHVQNARQPSPPMLLQAHERRLIVANQHHLTRRKVHRIGPVRRLLHAHPTQLGLMLHMHVLGVARHDPILAIGEDGEATLPRSTLQIGHELRIDPPFEHPLAGRHMDDLRAVVRQHKAAVFIQF